MTAPKTNVVHVNLQNPHASAPLVIELPVTTTVTQDDGVANIRANSARDDIPWLAATDQHSGIAVIVGGGPSVADTLSDIVKLRDEGATIFAANAAAQFLRKAGIEAHCQVIVDGRKATVDLIDPHVPSHMFASQVDPDCFSKVANATLFHCGGEGIEDHLPEARVTRGGYVILGGRTAGMAAMAVAFAKGFREFHVFGFDSSYVGRQSHAYAQPLNDAIACVDVEWAGKRFLASVAMKEQAEQFQLFAHTLIQAHGCNIAVYGEGLLQTIWNTPFAELSEKNKYQLMWLFDAYRNYSPGEGLVWAFIDRVKPEGLVIDFGCGTGRAALELSKRGHDVLLVDFADNCRDQEALHLPFVVHDLTRPLSARAKYGICADVLEHVPTADVPNVIRNIMASAESVLFQVSTVKDQFGAFVGSSLHQTVKPHSWWAMWFGNLCHIEWQEELPSASLFHVTRKEIERITVQ